jgi:uncharacterized membrane protein
MPGLRRSGDSAFVEAMQRINEAILNPLFMSLFMGGLLLAGTAVFLHWRTGVRWWVVAGCAAYLLMFIVTSAVNVPLNDQLAAAGDPAQVADLAAVRERFESTWATWNAVRAVASTAGFVAFAIALLRYGPA